MSTLFSKKKFGKVLSPYWYPRKRTTKGVFGRKRDRISISSSRYYLMRSIGTESKHTIKTATSHRFLDRSLLLFSTHLTIVRITINIHPHTSPLFGTSNNTLEPGVIRPSSIFSPSNVKCIYRSLVSGVFDSFSTVLKFPAIVSATISATKSRLAHG